MKLRYGGIAPGCSRRYDWTVDVGSGRQPCPAVTRAVGRDCQGLGVVMLSVGFSRSSPETCRLATLVANMALSVTVRILEV